MSKKTSTQDETGNGADTAAEPAQDFDQAHTNDYEKPHNNKPCAKCAEYINLSKRARADYENLKKDTQKWKTEFIAYANESLFLDIIPIMDNFIEAVGHISESAKKENWVIGIMHIKKQLEDVLKKNNVSQYGAPGEQFDPHFFEAITEVSDPEYKAGTIVKIIRYGYKIGERVLRIGQAAVGKN